MSHSVRPPRVAVWLLNLFVQGAESDAVLGDLSEEFFEVASRSATTQARRWYWRQAQTTIVHLFTGAFREAPLLTVAIVAGGVLLSRFVSGLPDKLLSTVTDRYLVYWSNHFHAYMFLATDGMSIAHFIGALFVGIVLALTAKGREMVVATLLSSVLAGMRFVACLALAVKTGGTSLVWILAMQSVDLLALIGGAVLVRTRRTVTAEPVSHA